MERESLRYLKNAREIVNTIPVEDNIYTDIKPVRKAFGLAYLAILEAINESLSIRGVKKKELPKSIEGYRKVLRKYFGVHDGKLMREFEMLYDALHIAGYYRGLIYNADAVKDYFIAAEKFIHRIK